MRFYRFLLLLLPRHRRERYGDEMASVFEAQRMRRGMAGWRRWVQEVAGMARFAIRERFGPRGESGTTGPAARRNGPGLFTELRWAWRGVRARGWRAVFIVGFFGVVLAANAILFAVADSLVFRTTTIPEVEQVVVLTGRVTDRNERTTATTSELLLRAWNRQPTIFASVGAFMYKTTFLTGDGPTERVNMADVTPEMFAVLATTPRWGRAFVEADTDISNGFTVVISESLARERFGRPHLAPGQTLLATAGPMHVVGVMPADFAFPDANHSIWRALDRDGPLTRSQGATTVARLARSVAAETAATRVTEVARVVGGEAGLHSYAAEIAPLVPPRSGTARRTMLLVLMGAAACLLLAACANAASLELAEARRRARVHAVQLALGASTAHVRRSVALEGALLIAASTLAAWGLATVGLEALLAMLPDGLRLGTQNPIDLDGRVLLFMAAAAAAVWILAALPPVVASSRTGLLTVLKSDDRASQGSRRSTRTRAALTIAQVAVAVTLAVGGLLYARAYQALLAVEKGFDSSGLAGLSFQIPPRQYQTIAEKRAFADRVLSDLQGRRIIEAGTFSSPPPSLGDSPSRLAIEIDDRGPLDTAVPIGAKWVDDRFFQVVRLPLKSGRYLSAGDLPTDVVVSETFARRFWIDVDAVGRTFRPSPRHPWHTIVGVVGDFRTSPTRMPELSDERAFYYALWREPPGGARPPESNLIDTGGSSGFVALTVRLADGVRPADALAAARSIDPGLQATLTLVDETYANQNADTRLTGRIVAAFSGLALVVALAGIYGLVHFLVTSQRREIGIRMALGAEGSDVRRLFLGSTLRLGAAGVTIGLVGAWFASGAIRSQLFGVSPTDPLTYAVVAAAVLATTLLATWQPARQAARIDPAITLRAE